MPTMRFTKGSVEDLPAPTPRERDLDWAEGNTTPGLALCLRRLEKNKELGLPGKFAQREGSPITLGPRPFVN